MPNFLEALKQGQSKLHSEMSVIESVRMTLEEVNIQLEPIGISLTIESGTFRASRGIKNSEAKTEYSVFAKHLFLSKAIATFTQEKDKFPTIVTFGDEQVRVEETGEEMERLATLFEQILSDESVAKTIKGLIGFKW